MNMLKKFFTLFVIFMLFPCCEASVITANYSNDTQNLVIEGRVSKSDSGKAVSVLLCEKETGSIGHIGMTEVDSEGAYIYKFKFSQNPSEYELKLRMDGSDISGTLINQVESFTNSVIMTSKITNSDGKPFVFGADKTLTLQTVLKNKFYDSDNLTVIAAFYTDKNKYLDCETVYGGTIDYDEFSKIVSQNITIPENACEMRLICLKDFQSLKPLNESTSVKNAYGCELYISPNGDDTATGTITEPLATIKGAKNKIRALKGEGAFPKGGVTVYIRGGEYFFDSTVSFTAADSGTEDSPILYKAYENETAVFTGGKYFTKDNLAPLAETDAMYERIQTEYKNKVMTLDLKALGVTDYGTYAEIGNSNADGVNDLRIELFSDGEACELAMWPNKTDKGFQYVHTTDVIVNANKDVESTASLKPVLKIEETASNRLKNWDLTKDTVFCEGLFGYKYFCDTVLVSGFDPDLRQLTLSKSVRGGFYDAARSKAHLLEWVKDKNEFRFFNVIEELDCENEYYIDRENNVLYFIPKKGFEKGGLTLSKQKFITLYDGADYISFEGIDFELSRRGFVAIDESKNISFKNCSFCDSSYEGIIIDCSYRNGKRVFYGEIDTEDFKVKTKNITIDGCAFKNLGKTGVTSAGGNLRTLERANYVIKNCTFDSCDRIFKNYSPAVSFYGSGADIVNCTIKNQYGQAIGVQGSDIYIAYNEFDNVVSQASDMGAIYSSGFCVGVDITNNYFHDIPWKFDEDYACAYTLKNGGELTYRPCVYIDGYQPGASVRNNIFENVPIACVMRSYGQTVKNNILTDVPLLLHSSPNYNVNSTVIEQEKDTFDAETVKPFKIIAQNEAVKNLWYSRYPITKTVYDTLNERTSENKKYPIIEVCENLMFYNSLNDYYEKSVLSDTNADMVQSAVLGYDYMISGGTEFNNIIFSNDKSVFADFDNKDFKIVLNKKIMSGLPDLIKIDKDKMGVH